MKIITRLITYFFFILTSKLHADGRLTNLNCHNKSKSILMEFQFKKENANVFSQVYKKIKGNFINIGEVVGQKPSLFILFEDKYQFLGVDFAWHLDRNTRELKPVLLSEGTIKLKEIPEKFYCKFF